MPQKQQYQDTREQNDHRKSNKSLNVCGSLLKLIPKKIVFPIMAAIVVALIPRSLTYIAELIAAPTSHVITALNALDELLAFGASFPVFVEVDEVGFAVFLIMIGHHALSTVHSKAQFAEQSFLCHIEHPFALISGAQLEIGIIHSLFPQFVHFVPFLAVLRKKLIAFRRLGQYFSTGVFWANGALECDDFLDKIYVQAHHAIAMVAFAHAFQLLRLVILFTDAARYFLQLVFW